MIIVYVVRVTDAYTDDLVMPTFACLDLPNAQAVTLVKITGDHPDATIAWTDVSRESYSDHLLLNGEVTYYTEIIETIEGNRIRVVDADGSIYYRIPITERRKREKCYDLEISICAVPIIEANTKGE